MIKKDLKFYFVPLLVIVVIFIVALFIPSRLKKTSPTITPTQSPFATTVPIRQPSTSNSSPTLVPVQNFTGVDTTQDLPQNIKDVGSQKTALRKQTPLTLSFGTITFDYGNDIFNVKLIEPTDLNKTRFIAWLNDNYPALTIDKFAFQ